jgi:hypothetical protein
MQTYQNTGMLWVQAQGSGVENHLGSQPSLPNILLTSRHTFMPRTAIRRYLTAGGMQRQTCAAAVQRKKRSLNRCSQLCLFCKEYTDTGAESTVTCTTPTGTGSGPKLHYKYPALLNTRPINTCFIHVLYCPLVRVSRSADHSTFET